MRAWLAASLASGLLSTACAGNRLADTNENAPTLLRLAPSEFLGAVRCEPGVAGALQAYVVDLYALGASTTDAGVLSETLAATSPEASCRTAVTFQAESRRRYVADIRAFDQSPVEGATPRWTASCGRGADGEGPALADAGPEAYGPIRALLGATVPIVNCTPLRAAGAVAGPGSIVVGLDAVALGGLRCGNTGGDVNNFRAQLGDDVEVADCGSDVIFDDVPLGVEQSIRIDAFSGTPTLLDAGAGAPDASLGTDGGASADAGISDAGISDASSPVSPGPGDAAPPITPRVRQWTTTCTATAVADMATRAVCAPLVETVD